MTKYEAMIIVKPEISENELKTLYAQLADVVTKNKGTVSQGAVWGERRKFYFPIKKHQEGVYYLLSFSADGQAIKDIRHAYNLNENILRVLFTKLD